ncbi:MAG TPA: hypothetical protein VGI57_14745 [Usitatibacter sp.]
MIRKMLWILLAAGFAFGGCSAESPPPAEKKSEAPQPLTVAQAQPPATPAAPAAKPKRKPTKNCSTSSGKCELTITVTSCTPAGVTIDHEILGIVTGTKDINIDWVIATNGYDFHKSDGIKFKGDDWRKEFDQATGNKNKFRWRDRNNAGGQPLREYEYSITVVKSDGSPCTTKDPVVINDS